MAKEKKASWFKVFLHQRALMDAVPDDVLGRALKAALAYLDTGEETELPYLEAAVYASMKQYVEESIEDYKRDIDNGKKGGRPRKNPGLPTVQEGEPPLPSLTEAEAEAEADTEAEAEERVERVYPSGKPTARARFVPPNIEEATAYCREMGLASDPQRFIDYYTSIGWKVGKHPMKDWKAALRNWNTKESLYPRTTQKQEPQIPTWTVGTTF